MTLTVMQLFFGGAYFVVWYEVIGPKQVTLMQDKMNFSEETPWSSQKALPLPSSLRSQKVYLVSEVKLGHEWIWAVLLEAQPPEPHLTDAWVAF